MRSEPPGAVSGKGRLATGAVQKLIWNTVSPSTSGEAGVGDLEERIRGAAQWPRMAESLSFGDKPAGLSAVSRR